MPFKHKKIILWHCHSRNKKSYSSPHCHYNLDTVDYCFGSAPTLPFIPVVEGELQQARPWQEEAIAFSAFYGWEVKAFVCLDGLDIDINIGYVI